MATRPRTSLTQVLLLATLAACEEGPAGSAASGSAAGSESTATSTPVTPAVDVPAACSLVPDTMVASLLPANPPPVEGAPLASGDHVFPVATCVWGTVDDPKGALGVQIGTADADGHDVVANRATALDPGLVTPIGVDGKESMYVGELPTGGGLGSSIFFRHHGFSVLIGIVGEPGTLGAVERVAAEVMSTLDDLVAAGAG